MSSRKIHTHSHPRTCHLCFPPSFSSATCTHLQAEAAAAKAAAAEAAAREAAEAEAQALVEGDGAAAEEAVDEGEAAAGSGSLDKAEEVRESGGRLCDEGERVPVGCVCVVERGGGERGGKAKRGRGVDEGGSSRARERKSPSLQLEEPVFARGRLVRAERRRRRRREV